MHTKNKKIYNRKKQMVGYINKNGKVIDLNVIKCKENIYIDSNKVGQRKRLALLFHLKDRYDLMPQNFNYESYSLTDSHIEKSKLIEGINYED